MSTAGVVSNEEIIYDVSADLPEPPEKPLDSDCCGTGCTPCVFDIYDEEVLRWRTECDRIRSGAIETGLPTGHVIQALSTSEFKSFALDSITRLTEDSCLYRFIIPENRKLGLKIGQHLIMRGKLEGKTITRQYTPVSDQVSDQACRGRGHFDVLIKIDQARVVRKVDNAIHWINHCLVDSVVCFVNTFPADSDLSGGQRYPAFEQLGPGLEIVQERPLAPMVYPSGKMSSYVRSWQIGDMIEWRGPYGNFSYTPNQYRRLGMLAAGTGIAPMLQVVQGILSNEDDETLIHLVYSCRTYEEILMKHTLDEMKAYWNFSVLYVLSKESEADQSKVKYGDHVYYGRITQELMSSEMPEPSRDVHVLICGTKSFDKDMINYLKAIGYTSDMYFKF